MAQFYERVNSGGTATNTLPRGAAGGSPAASGRSQREEPARGASGRSRRAGPGQCGLPRPGPGLPDPRAATKAATKAATRLTARGKLRPCSDAPQDIAPFRDPTPIPGLRAQGPAAPPGSREPTAGVNPSARPQALLAGGSRPRLRARLTVARRGGDGGSPRPRETTPCSERRAGPRSQNDTAEIHSRAALRTQPTGSAGWDLLIGRHHGLFLLTAPPTPQRSKDNVRNVWNRNPRGVL
ncbi:uncharacterized protein [Vulpes vulpes]|uniref:Uncharacterized protein n=1 Tax=Vulpes vulpes TaxID=9627 RepID=A0ABM4Z4P8_VULVU